MTKTTCKKCGKEMSPGTIDAIAGDDGGARLTLNGMPALCCEEEHRRLLDVRFPDTVLAKIERMAEDRVAPARTKGLIFRRTVCRSCGHELPRDALHHGELHFEVDLDRVAPFAVDLELPLYRCPSCGTEQAASEKLFSTHLPVALVHAFKAGALSPA